MICTHILNFLLVYVGRSFKMARLIAMLLVRLKVVLDSIKYM